MPEQVYNFYAGPAILPNQVLKQAALDIVDFNQSGMGIIEISHRSQAFTAVIQETEALIRELLGVPGHYKVLFLQGGASSQFFMVPMNLLQKDRVASYLNTGVWSNKAIREARLFGQVEVPYSSEATGFTRVPQHGEYTVNPKSEYLYFVSNNTVYGTQFHAMPEPDAMLVADMSSDILSRPVDVSRFGLIYAGAQKNIGPAGVTLVIIREDLLERVSESVPTMLQYRTHAAADSLFNTPPVFSVYGVGQVMRWLRDQGGVAAMDRLSKQRSSLLYEVIDSTDFYRGHAEKASRSAMNVTFTLPTRELEEKFLRETTEQGFIGLKGHRLLGGCRASLYNAFPLEGVEKLAEFMQAFARKN